MSIAVQREAQAMCRRDGGPLDTVEYLRDGRVVDHFIGSPYDALSAAKDAVFNLPVSRTYDDVRIVKADGTTRDIAAIRAARY